MTRVLTSFLLFLCVTPLTLAQPIIPASPDLAARAWVLMDATTGEIIAEQNAMEALAPASLTKLMTAYLAFEEIDSGRMSMDEEVLVSENAWAKGGAASGGSTMFLPPNQPATVADLLRGMIVQSGNDASIALAEHIAGGEDAFADLMTQTARRLGLDTSFFLNSTGLPAPGHQTSALDMALLARAIIRQHPELYRIYSEKEFEYNGIRQPNRNALLWRDASVDGLKTGHTNEAGYCLVASALRGDMRLISVVMGAASEDVRANESQKLLTWGFRYYVTHSLYEAGENLSTEVVWEGKLDSLALGLAEEVILTIPRGDAAGLSAELEVPEILQAPIQQGQEIGRVRISYRGELVQEAPLVAQHEVQAAGFFGRLWDRIQLFFMNLFGKS